MTSVCGTFRREMFGRGRINSLIRKVNNLISKEENSKFELYRQHNNTTKGDAASCIRSSYTLNPNCYPFSRECGSHRVYFRCFSGSTPKLPIIYLFTKEDCTLCDEAKLALTPYKHRFILEEVDITLPENEPWYEMYKYDIPVFHMFEDFLFKHRVNFDVLEKALADFEAKHGKT